MTWSIPKVAKLFMIKYRGVGRGIGCVQWQFIQKLVISSPISVHFGAHWQIQGFVNKLHLKDIWLLYPTTCFWWHIGGLVANWPRQVIIFILKIVIVVTLWSVLGGHELKKSHQGTPKYRDKPPTMSLYDFNSIWVD